MHSLPHSNQERKKPKERKRQQHGQIEKQATGQNSE